MVGRVAARSGRGGGTLNAQPAPAACSSPLQQVPPTTGCHRAGSAASRSSALSPPLSPRCPPCLQMAGPLGCGQGGRGKGSFARCDGQACKCQPSPAHAALPQTAAQLCKLPLHPPAAADPFAPAQLPCHPSTCKHPPGMRAQQVFKRHGIRGRAAQPIPGQQTRSVRGGASALLGGQASKQPGRLGSKGGAASSAHLPATASSCPSQKRRPSS